LKKVSGKKERDAKAAEAQRILDKKAQAGKEERDIKGSKDLLGDEDNNDVIF
jgi:V-type H+-transporting ATPase subunit D